jgi:hypothetical protein
VGNLEDYLLCYSIAERITEMSSFSIRYSDQYDGEVLLVFCFAKVVRIKERSSVLLCFVFVVRIRVKVLCLAFLH